MCDCIRPGRKPEHKISLREVTRVAVYSGSRETWQEYRKKLSERKGKPQAISVRTFSLPDLARQDW